MDLVGLVSKSMRLLLHINLIAFQIVIHFWQDFSLEYRFQLGFSTVFWETLGLCSSLSLLSWKEEFALLVIACLSSHSGVESLRGGSMWRNLDLLSLTYPVHLRVQPMFWSCPNILILKYFFSWKQWTGVEKSLGFGLWENWVQILVLVFTGWVRLVIFEPQVSYLWNGHYNRDVVKIRRKKLCEA